MEIFCYLPNPLGKDDLILRGGWYEVSGRKEIALPTRVAPCVETLAQKDLNSCHPDHKRERKKGGEKRSETCVFLLMIHIQMAGPMVEPSSGVKRRV